jgi:hypothetical protein
MAMYGKILSIKSAKGVYVARLQIWIAGGRIKGFYKKHILKFSKNEFIKQGNKKNSDLAGKFLVSCDFRGEHYCSYHIADDNMCCINGDVCNGSFYKIYDRNQYRIKKVFSKELKR